MQIYNSDFDINYKNDNSPLTLADKEAHSIILSYLEKTDYPILSDNIIYDLAQTLVFTFPLAQQDLDFPSLLGYPSYITKLRIASKNLVNEIWRDYT